MYRAANSDTLTAANRAWREGNRDWMVAYRRARYLADPASFKAAANAWRRGNPEAYKAIKHRQRARRRGAYARLTRLQWAETVAQFNGACAYCLKPTPRPTIDHMVPLCRGGEHTVENVVPACSYCNTSKGARSIFAMLPRCGVSA
jgi:5-methylcytosine-specific restriction endonuclease McrA